MWSIVVAVLTNPALVSGLGKAGQAVVDWWHGLAEEDRAKIEADGDARHAAAVSSVHDANDDLAKTRAYLDAHTAAAAAHPNIPAPVAEALTAMGVEFAARFAAPLPAPKLVSE